MTIPAAHAWLLAFLRRHAEVSAIVPATHWRAPFHPCKVKQ